MHPYQGVTIKVPTKHGKAAAIKKGFIGLLEANIVEVEVDTDQFGTFTGEVERKGSPYNTALAKLDLVKNADYAIASEGSIGNDSQIPFMISDIEILVFKDFKNDLIITELHRSFEIKAGEKKFFPDEDYTKFLKLIDFPNHGVIAKGIDLTKSSPIKGITSIEELERAMKKIFETSPTVILESDFRAHKSPSRMENIEHVARKLAKRIVTLCPECRTPGFGIKRYEKGVICGECKRVNPDAIHQEILSCVKCSHESLGEIVNQVITPDKCAWCNP